MVILTARAYWLYQFARETADAIGRLSPGHSIQVYYQVAGRHWGLIGSFAELADQTNPNTALFFAMVHSIRHTGSCSSSSGKALAQPPCGPLLREFKARCKRCLASAAIVSSCRLPTIPSIAWGSAISIRLPPFAARTTTLQGRRSPMSGS